MITWWDLAPWYVIFFAFIGVANVAIYSFAFFMVCIKSFLDLMEKRHSVGG